MATNVPVIVGVVAVRHLSNLPARLLPTITLEIYKSIAEFAGFVRMPTVPPVLGILTAPTLPENAVLPPAVEE